MYPPAFDYAAPRDLDEALSLLAAHGDDAKILAGGQSLIPLLKLRFAAPSVLIDINRIPGLDGVEEQGDALCIGTLARHADLAAHPLLAARYPLMTAAAPQIADPLVRNLGTMGGSLAHADPAGDWCAVALAMNASVVARGASAQRTIPVAELFEGMLTTVLAPDELLAEIRVPVPRGRPGGAYLKLERKVGDFASVGVAVHLELEPDAERIGRAGIGLCAVGPQSLAAREAEAALQGAAPSDELFAHAAAAAAAAAEPTGDLRGSEAYKREVVRVFVERGLRQALAMARAR